MKNWIADGTFTGQDADDLLASIDEQNDRDWDNDHAYDVMILDEQQKDYESCTGATDCGCSYCAGNDPFADA